MSWIKENPFVAVLGGVTVVGAGALLFLGTHFAGDYEKALTAYKDDSDVVAKAEKLNVYPTKTNAQAKSKAIEDYKSEIGKLQDAYRAFRPAEVKNIAPQEFTNNLKASSDKIRAAFTSANATLPESFFVGFENYKSSLAQEGATGILDYELGAFTNVFLALAKAGPKELKNVHRPLLAEESGGVFTDKEAIYRPMSLEVTFRGGEKAFREFGAALASSTDYYYVIRTVRVENDKLIGPVPGDAKFETAKAAGAGGASADPFAGFSLGGETAAPAGGDKAKPAAADSSKILQQVLGDEDVTVFVRLDVLRFLPAKDTSKL
ncbi:Amuc_1100 family pilus-like protein [Luteolibacter sp. LG18]|uniref:Amuc_1100 family pilus-like protein n=1 Tax=Luteolibacter sp. LG18 TaxID=2819286 RepID=UPI002B308795|nr:hypothetical protein llg_02850 [Luteolibacter sp. LG18]